VVEPFLLIGLPVERREISASLLVLLFHSPLALLFQHACVVILVTITTTLTTTVVIAGLPSGAARMSSSNEEERRAAQPRFQPPMAHSGTGSPPEERPGPTEGSPDLGLAGARPGQYPQRLHGGRGPAGRPDRAHLPQQRPALGRGSVSQDWTSQLQFQMEGSEVLYSLCSIASPCSALLFFSGLCSSSLIICSSSLIIYQHRWCCGTPNRSWVSPQQRQKLVGA